MGPPTPTLSRPAPATPERLPQGTSKITEPQDSSSPASHPLTFQLSGTVSNHFRFMRAGAPSPPRSPQTRSGAHTLPPRCPPPSAPKSQKQPSGQWKWGLAGGSPGCPPGQGLRVQGGEGSPTSSLGSLPEHMGDPREGRPRKEDPAEPLPRVCARPTPRALSPRNSGSSRKWLNPMYFYTRSPWGGQAALGGGRVG